jgi:hypothetical protein
MKIRPLARAPLFCTRVDRLRLLLAGISLALLTTTPVAGQWLNRPTPGIPRMADGKPNLAAAAPRTADGKPDFTGVWTGQPQSPDPDPRDVQPWANEAAGHRAEDFFKSRPMFQCRPSGPETFAQSTGQGVWKRMLQTPSLIAILNDDLTYRQIFMDGRTLETAPFPNWMGYSVGRWEGDTLVVDSFGFNDRTWLNGHGLPHTEALRMTERYRRRDFGHLRIDVTLTDPSTFTKPIGFVVNMELAADTEMLEGVCETGTDHWTGSASDLRTSAVIVPPDILAKYVGVYSGIWAGRPRTVEVVLSAAGLVATIGGETWPLMAKSETLFESSEGYGYEFIRNSNGQATHVVEIHVSGNYRYERQR